MEPKCYVTKQLVLMVMSSDQGVCLPIDQKHDAIKMCKQLISLYSYLSYS